MGRFTALDDPVVDHIIESHLQRIVTAILTHLEPHAVVLRGSFGRGEGSVLPQNGGLRFLSDYEIDVATFSPCFRSAFAKLSRDLSAELGVEAGLRWIRPDCLTRDRIGPFPLRSLAMTISLYEFRYGSRLLHGQDIVSSAAAVDPGQILLMSGVELLLNRMAESLYTMTLGERSEDDDLKCFRWINKTTLACAESLLLLWRQYHYTYRERGRRFARMAGERLGFMVDQRAVLLALVERATEFKLRPRRGLYPDPPRETWREMLPACDAVFRHVVEQVMQISFRDYSELPGQFLARPAVRPGLKARASFGARKLYETHRAVRARCLPRSLLAPFHASQIVYSVVPLLFFAYGNEERGRMFETARRWLNLLGPLQPPSSDSAIEWDYLRQRLTYYWKMYCY